ncbi:hypothetical protein BJ741DRAFT_707005 [Chytriomyces cf. hyalinus JEL632]|nr:hypothetical protein BJ741DRAFT_707005 [Chytriomyces cf. hyalinus JEL632]
MSQQPVSTNTTISNVSPSSVASRATSTSRAISPAPRPSSSPVQTSRSVSSSTAIVNTSKSSAVTTSSSAIPLVSQISPSPSPIIGGTVEDLTSGYGNKADSSDLGATKYVLIAFGVLIPVVMGLCLYQSWRKKQRRREQSIKAGNLGSLPWVAADRRPSGRESAVSVSNLSTRAPGSFDSGKAIAAGVGPSTSSLLSQSGTTDTASNWKSQSRGLPEMVPVRKMSIEGLPGGPARHASPGRASRENLTELSVSEVNPLKLKQKRDIFDP